jgi:hypothetical protein
MNKMDKLMMVMMYTVITQILVFMLKIVLGAEKETWGKHTMDCMKSLEMTRESIQKWQESE